MNPPQPDKPLAEVYRLTAYKRRLARKLIDEVKYEMAIALGFVACNYGHADHNVHKRAELTLEYLRSATARIDELLLSVT